MSPKKRNAPVRGDMPGSTSHLKPSGEKSFSKVQRAEQNAILNLLHLVTDNDKWSDGQLVESLGKVDAGLENIRRLQKSRDLAFPPRTSTEFSNFADWIEARGVDLINSPFRFDVAVDNDETDNATLFATRKITAGELIMSIPSSMMMTTETAKASSLGAFIASAPALSKVPSIVLALHVLAEALSDCSRYREYIRIFPSSFTIPYSLPFRARDVIALRPSVAFSRAINTTRSQVTHYANIYELLRKDRTNHSAIPLECFTYRNFEWAVSVVMTRQNSIPSAVAGHPACLALVPVWDMCNHAPGPQTTSVVLDPTTGNVKVECTAMRDYDDGDPITIFYGNRPNVELLLFSGFVQPENAFDSVPVPMALQGADVVTKIQKALLLRRHVHAHSSGSTEILRDNADNVSIHGHVRAGGVIDPMLALIARVSVMTMDPDELASAAKPNSSFQIPSGDEFPLEDTAIEEIKKAIRNLREEYQKSLASVDRPMDRAQRLIRELHVEEDRLLCQALEKLESDGIP